MYCCLPVSEERGGEKEKTETVNSVKCECKSDVYYDRHIITRTMHLHNNNMELYRIAL